MSPKRRTRRSSSWNRHLLQRLDTLARHIHELEREAETASPSALDYARYKLRVRSSQLHQAISRIKSRLNSYRRG